MLKVLPFVFLLAFCLFSVQNISAQTKEVPEFYQNDLLKSDFKQTAVVVYVDVKSRELVDKMGGGDCEQNKGGGLCLYLLKGEIKEVFKGKVNKKNFQFYTTTDSDYQPKDNLLGEKIVFLNWGKNYPNKKMSLGTMENSTRSNEYEVVAQMRNIAKNK